MAPHWPWMVMLALGCATPKNGDDGPHTGTPGSIDTAIALSEELTPTLPGTVLEYQATWDGVVAFLDDYCVTCHIEGGEASWDIASTLGRQLTDPLPDEKILIVAGDPTVSILWRSLVGASNTSLMPLNAPSPLPPEKVGHIRVWIEAGASLD